MDLEWIAEDSNNTLGHISRMRIEGKPISSPHHALTSKDYEIVERVARSRELKNNNIVVNGEILSYSNFKGVGTDTEITNNLFNKMGSRIVKDKVNIVHIRIPENYVVGDSVIPVNKVSELKTSALVGIQIEAKASVIIPPINTGISSIEVFKTIYDRTKIEIQSSKYNKELGGYIPSTNQLDLVPEMIQKYLKDGVRIFFVDFSGSSMNRALIRTVVSSIRAILRTKKKRIEDPDKQYYLHVLDIASSRKSTMPVTSITDILTHSYGVDSTSGVMWGGGKLEKNKLRYFNMKDYGAYRIGGLPKYVLIDPNLTEGSVQAVYEKLRADRLIEYNKECSEVSSRISGNSGNHNDYGSYLTTKTGADKDVINALSDIKEIKANSKRTTLFST